MSSSTDGPSWMSGPAAPNLPVVVVHAGEKNRISGIVAEGRPLTSPPLAVDLLADSYVRSSIESYGGTLLVTSSLAEAIEWLAAGVPAVPIGELTDHGKAEKLGKRLECLSRAPTSGNRTIRHRVAKLKEYVRSAGTNVDPFLVAELANPRAKLRLEALLVAPM
jgi:hypothetical protein